MAKKELKLEIETPAGVEIKIENGIVKVKGPKGEVSKRLLHKRVSLHKENGTIRLNVQKASKREKAVLGSFRAHLRNMIYGVTEGHVYRLKICSGHFPMTVVVQNKEFIVKNLLGEKVPRKIPVREGVDIKIDGDEVTITGNDKDKVSQQASSIEEMAKRRGFDRRVFQDGIYIIQKDRKEMK